MNRQEHTGMVLVEGYKRGRLTAEAEYTTPRGGTLLIPMDAVQEALTRGTRFGRGRRSLLGYRLQDCRYERTIGTRAWLDDFHNLITNEGLEGIANMLCDTSATYDTGIKKVEIGDGDGAAVTPTVDATALVDSASVRFSCNAPTQSAGVITVVTLATVAGGSGIYIRELGVFAHDNTNTRAAGNLLSYASYDRNNTTAVDLTITHTIDLGRYAGV